MEIQTFAQSSQLFPVLIETYWNVNSVYEWVKVQGETVLIETYWNVNAGLEDRSYIQEPGINRNILECK